MQKAFVYPVTVRSPLFHILRLEDVDLFTKRHHPLHRQYFFEITYISRMTVPYTICIDAYQTSVLSHQLALICPDRLLSLTLPEGVRTEGFMLLFKPDFFATGIENVGFIRDFPFFKRTTTPFCLPNPSIIEEIRLLLEKMHAEYQAGNPFCLDVIRGYLTALLFSIKRIYAPESERIDVQGRKSQLTADFEDLVARHCVHKRTIGDYANLLSISPDYLYEAVKATVNKSPLDLIHEQLIDQAKALLRQTTWSVSEIAYHLHFQDNSYFSRFFRQHTHLSPQQFRATQSRAAH